MTPLLEGRVKEEEGAEEEEEEGVVLQEGMTGNRCTLDPHLRLKEGAQLPSEFQPCPKTLT